LKKRRGMSTLRVFSRRLLAAIVLTGLVVGGCGGSDEETLVCRDSFSGGTLALCCPDPVPDCTGKPDGYPGYHCVARDNHFCSCACNGGQWSCGC
jgi:hypothetical protein